MFCCSSAFFLPDRLTSPHPLIIGAGLDGSGLTLLARALETLKQSVAFPAIDLQQCTCCKSFASGCSMFMSQLDDLGLQAGTHERP